MEVETPAKTVKVHPTAGKEKINAVSLHPFVIVARRLAGSAKLGARATRLTQAIQVPLARTLKGHPTAGKEEINAASLHQFATVARRLAGFANLGARATLLPQAIQVPLAETLEGYPTAGKEKINAATLLQYVIDARRLAGSAHWGAQVSLPTLAIQGETLVTPPAETHIVGEPATAKSGNRPAKMTSIPNSDPTVRGLVVSAALLVRTPTRRDLATVGNGKSRALMTDIQLFKRIVARLVGVVANKCSYARQQHMV